MWSACTSTRRRTRSCSASTRNPQFKPWTTQKTLPMQPGQAEKRTHNYVRHGTTTLFAALQIATGEVTGLCKPRHRHQEFLVFLRHLARGYPDQQLHLIMDNYAAPKHP